MRTSRARRPTKDGGPLDGLPGNPMMWILILGELAVFGALLVGFSVARTLDPLAFAQGQAALDVRLGGLNTLVLIASGWCAALAVEGRKTGRSGRPQLAAAMALGAVFLVVKGAEYAAKISLGYGPDSGTFFELYYLVTGFHALHVLAGIVLLAVVARYNSLENLETGTAFWHMVDLVWLLVFPVVYLIGRAP